MRSCEARFRPVKGSALGGVVISETVWPASVRAATVVAMARSMAGVGGTTPRDG